jgi:DNA polymerase III epsilon subunit-like protein
MALDPMHGYTVLQNDLNQNVLLVYASSPAQAGVVAPRQHGGMMNSLFISIDIESDGPIPGEYSMLSLGACVVDNPDQTFYIELKPISVTFQVEALEVSGLNRRKLESSGVDPVHALRSFESWVQEVSGEAKPVFLANNVGFDWMFVCWYFWHFLGRNPFGHSSCDLRSYVMGAFGSTWEESSLKRLPTSIGLTEALTHNALEDALAQAPILERVNTERQERIARSNRAAYQRGMPRDALDMD